MLYADIIRTPEAFDGDYCFRMTAQAGEKGGSVAFRIADAEISADRALLLRYRLKKLGSATRAAVELVLDDGCTLEAEPEEAVYLTGGGWLCCEQRLPARVGRRIMHILATASRDSGGVMDVLLDDIEIIAG